MVCINIHVMFSEGCTAYDDIWLLGDRFINNSVDVLEDYCGLFNSVPKHTRFDSYIAENYDILAYTNDDDNVVKSALGRMHNAMAIALNENEKLPKYVPVVMESDIIRCIKYDKPGLTELYGLALHWLMDEYHEAIVARKGMLPSKAVKYMYPQVFVVALLQHKIFKDNMNRFRFNKSIEVLARKYKEVKVLRMERRWNYEDPTLVSQEGRITDEGLLTYWASIDEAIQFWETGKKKSHSEQQFVRQLFSEHKARTITNSNSSRERLNSPEERVQATDENFWNRGERTLPKPNPRR